MPSANRKQGFGCGRIMEFPFNSRIKQERQVYASGLDQKLKIGVQQLPHSLVLDRLDRGLPEPTAANLSSRVCFFGDSNRATATDRVPPRDPLHRIRPVRAPKVVVAPPGILDNLDPTSAVPAYPCSSPRSGLTCPTLPSADRPPLPGA